MVTKKKMHKVSDKERKSEAQRVRLTVDENAGLKKLAEDMGVKPSKLIRRLIREAVNQGPDFFDDGVKELRETNRQIAAIGRNLNRLVLMMNSGDPINGIDLRNEYENLQLLYENIQGSYLELFRRSKNRQVGVFTS
jgi:predicted DNA-binding protein